MRVAIIQAGGMGTRMGRHTRNKPKCLVPHMGRTILENDLAHLRGYKVYVIVDHLADLVESYLREILGRGDVSVFRAPEKSTTSGIKEISKMHPESEVLVVWSDLFLSSDPQLGASERTVVAVTDDFECRWSVRDGSLVKLPSKENGVMGLFGFPGYDAVKDFDSSLSLVGGNLARLSVPFLTKKVAGAVEIGREAEYDEMVRRSSKSRFFNRVEIKEDHVEKRCVDDAFSHLIEDERRWYSFVGPRVDFVPEVVSEDPFRIRRVIGDSPHALNLSFRDRESVLSRMCENLLALHSLGSSPSALGDYEEVYVSKTIGRVSSVSAVVPFFERESISINGLPCKNPFRDAVRFGEEIRSLFGGEYRVVHGDATFSNTVVDRGLRPYLIDPRGRFGSTAIYGDPRYDWAKLYYSAAGNYDAVNSKRVEVTLGASGVDLEAASNGYEDLAPMVVEASGVDADTLGRLHALIWLSLTGYVKEDVDSLMYAFYKGVLLWNYPTE